MRTLLMEHRPEGTAIALMEDRLLEKHKQKNAVSTVLTGSYREQVEEAYRQMNRERGYRPKPRHGTKLRFMGFKH